MISRWHIFFSLSAAMLAPVVMATTVTGRVQLTGSRDHHVRKNHDFSGVVAWLEPASGHRPVPRGAHAEMIQQGKNFRPHILAIPLGATVDFPNRDPIFHNAFSNFSGKIFDLALYPPGSTRSVHFDRPGVVRIFCNIHAAMSAVIVVVDTPYYSTSQTSGGFSLPLVSPGDYVLHFFHERATPQTLAALERRISVGSSALALPAVSISESDYLPLPHKNKYGKDYPPATGYTAPGQP